MPEEAAGPVSESEGPSSGWWKDFVEVVPPGYQDLIAAEEDAREIVHFHPTFVPGLLQTRAYARALMAPTILKNPPPDISQLVEVRMMRQRMAWRDRRRRLTFLLDESCLYRPVGSSTVMAEQMAHVLRMTDEPSVRLTVLPFRAEPHPGLLGPFMLLRYDGGLDDVLCFEWQGGDTLVYDDPVLAARYGDLAKRLSGSDSDGETTRRLIREAISRLER